VEILQLLSSDDQRSRRARVLVDSVWNIRRPRVQLVNRRVPEGGPPHGPGSGSWH
jgi:hypothetical protein